MLTDKEFVETSLVSNLYYLRTLREFTARLELSIPPAYTDFINKSDELAVRCEKLGRDLVNISNLNIPKSAVESDIIVTDYTLQLEELTEKLFKVNIDTNITKDELLLKPGTPVITNKLIQELERINNEALLIANDFLELGTNLSESVKNQDTFIFYYNSLNDYMKEEVKLYILVLKRLIDKDKIDPVYVADYEFGYNQLLKKLATFIRGEIDPAFESDLDKANQFVEEYKNLIEEYQNMQISPENQLNMTRNSLELANRFKNFIESILEKLLKKEIYLISPPITKDNALTEVNFFIYNLNTYILENN